MEKGEITNKRGNNKSKLKWVGYEVEIPDEQLELLHDKLIKKIEIVEEGKVLVHLDDGVDIVSPDTQYNLEVHEKHYILSKPDSTDEQPLLPE